VTATTGPTEVNKNPPPTTGEGVIDPNEERVYNALGALLGNQHFIKGMALELEKARRTQQLYPLYLNEKQLEMPGVVMTQPMPVGGHALLLTRFPTLVGGGSPNAPALAVLARSRALPQAQRTGNAQADYDSVLDIIVYNDHPFDLNQRTLITMTEGLTKELRRQILALGSNGNLDEPSSAFYYLTVVKVGAANDGGEHGTAG